MGKNLLINSDFICKAALMSGDETKHLLLWCFNYMVNGIVPSDEDLDNATPSVYNSFNQYIPYMDWCTRNYKPKHNNNEIELDSEFESELEKQRTKLFREINAKKDEILEKEEEKAEEVEGNFVGKIEPKPNKKNKKKDEETVGSFVGTLKPNDKF